MKKLFAVLMTGLAVSAFALDSLDQWATKIWAQPLPASKDSVAVILTQEGPGMFEKATAKTAYTTGPDGSMEIDMETHLIETSAPWKVSDQYEIPADFKAAFPDSQNYVVADFKLGGLFSVMYKYHNYWIFKIALSGLEYLGSFGGNPKKATFSFISE